MTRGVCRRRAASAFALALAVQTAAAAPEEPLVLVVLDPLAAPLACDCVAGYAQRDYGRLAGRLTDRLGRPVRAVFANRLGDGLRDAGGRTAIVIGKESVVRHDAAEAGVDLRPLARLSGADGATTFTGLFVVRSNDAARTLADLRGRSIVFGPAEEPQRHAAAFVALRAAGVEPPVAPTIAPTCTEAAGRVADGTADCAVVSSYALPLIEGCGVIEPGRLRVLGRTGPVPFILAFAAGKPEPAGEARWRDALLSIREDSALLRAMESRDGFVPAEPTGWTDWRGSRARDARVAWLPDALPARPAEAWRRSLRGPALSGLAADDGLVVVADRDPAGGIDIWRALDPRDGAELWTHAYAAPGEIDFTPAPRATPVLDGDRVYVMGAFGHLRCLRRSDGAAVWSRDLAREFGVRAPTWGWCATPLRVDDIVVVNPGGTNASLAAFDAASGALRWTTPGAGAAYASFILHAPDGVRQIIGYDADSLGGWDPRTGRRLWRLVPPETGDFNVPTPIAVGDRLLVSTENNGTRLYGFRPDGTIQPAPLAACARLAPDTATPVVAGGLVFGHSGGLHCLRLDDLRPAWSRDEPPFLDHGSYITGSDRVLFVDQAGRAVLFDAAADGFRARGDVHLLDEPSDSWAHPALVGRRLYIRADAAVVAFDLP